ncbi:protein of unknown function, might belong to Cytosine permease [Shewanella benthica]|uniref:Uncharacterized protein n=1 Tax=Shewanella benthica TaxID=43661 RepID=A0A330M4V7_9GAMM|nr:protein of unknown function, might belong to Cytosine permease [Shewanella benthica]
MQVTLLEWKYAAILAVAIGATAVHFLLGIVPINAIFIGTIC